MIDICPTITTADETEYRRQLEQIMPFARRIHIDLSDDVFTPRALVAVDKVWWPGGMRADLHVMHKYPLQSLAAFIALQPQLVIVHAEADGRFIDFATAVHRHGIEAGVALLPQTPVEVLQPALEYIDHVLIFSGNLGYQGGSEADLTLLEKVKTLKAWRPAIEIGWDGGVNDQNIRALVQGGVEVINVGGFIQKSSDPQAAHATLKALVV